MSQDPVPRIIKKIATNFYTEFSLFWHSQHHPSNGTCRACSGGVGSWERFDERDVGLAGSRGSSAGPLTGPPFRRQVVHRGQPHSPGSKSGCSFDLHWDQNSKFTLSWPWPWAKIPIWPQGRPRLFQCHLRRRHLYRHQHNHCRPRRTTWLCSNRRAGLKYWINVEIIKNRFKIN